MPIKPALWNVSPALVAPEWKWVWQQSAWVLPILAFPPHEVLGATVTVNGNLTERSTIWGPAIDYPDSPSAYLSLPVARMPTAALTVAVVWEVDVVPTGSVWANLVGTTGDANSNGLRLMLGDVSGTKIVRFRTVQAGSGVNEDLTITGNIAVGDTVLAAGTYDGVTTKAHFRNLTTGIRLDSSGSAESGALSHTVLEIGRVATDAASDSDGALLSAAAWSYGWNPQQLDLLADNFIGPFAQGRQIPLPLMYRHALRGRR